MTIPYYLVDVFAQKKYAGNQLAVLRTGALSDEEMQAIALETRLSETTFILSDSPHDGGYNVRIFTTEQELPFAGHPTLGTAYIIQQHIIREPVETVTLHLKAGQIPVRFNYRSGQPDLLWMKQLPPAFGQTVDHVALAGALRLTPQDFDDRYPVQCVSTGIGFLIAPLKTRAAVTRAQVEREALAALLSQAGAHGLLIFCAEPYESSNTLNTRGLFAGVIDSNEDAATGSANGCLAAYLVQQRYFGTANIDIRVEQGYEIRRPSLLYLRAHETGSEIAVQVGGRVIPIAQGQWGG